MSGDVDISVKNANNQISISTSKTDTNITVGAVDTNSTVTTAISSASYWADLAEDWAVKMNGIVTNTDYSSKYYALIAKENAGQSNEDLKEIEALKIAILQAAADAANSAEQAAINAQNVASGFIWKKFNYDNWAEKDGLYTYSFIDPPIVMAVFKGDIQERTLLTNVNISIGEINTITALEPFEGFILGGNSYQSDETILDIIAGYTITPLEGE